MKIKKIIIIFSFFVIGINVSFSQDTSRFIDNQNEFNHELKLFIDTINQHYYGKTAQYIIYVAKIYFDPLNQNGFCFTLGYIFNNYEYKYVSPNYITYIDTNVVLLRIDKNLVNKIFPKESLKSINKEDSTKVFKKLYSEVGITGVNFGLTYCNYNGIIEKKFYHNSDEIPFKNSIYHSLPSYTIKQIK